MFDLSSRGGVLLLATVLAACDGAFQPPLAPDVEPQSLIGQSPLQPLELDKTTTPPKLVVGLTVNRGIAEVSTEDKFRVRVTGEFKLSDGSPAGATDPNEQDILGFKDTGIRDGSDVAVIMDIDIPAPTWYAIQGLNAVAVQVLAQLIMTTGAGADRVLDEVVISGMVDPTL